MFLNIHFYILFKKSLIFFIYFRLITDADKKIERPQHPRNNANIFEIISYR